MEPIDIDKLRAALQKQKEANDKEELMSLHIESPKVSTFKDIAMEMTRLYAKKNADYGDSFGESFREFGLGSAVIRIGDKYRRFKNLIARKAMVKDESIEDTLLDMANYAIMTVIELRQSQ